MCKKPYREGVMEYGCGSCMPCRINRRRLWTGRLMLEAHLHKHCWFVTLTYAPKHLPAGGTLVPKDMQDFMKRLREYVYPEKIRFYGVGEYGDVSGRPHYHLLLFGLSDASFVAKAWTLGRVHVGGVTPQSAAYVVSYTLKGMTKEDDKRLKGRHPEFARMSNGGRAKTGGIGAGATEVMLNALTEHRGGAKAVAVVGDVPGRVRTDGKFWPLGRYLRNRLRSAYGMDDAVRNGIVRNVALLLRSELAVKGARDLHEQKRVQAARRANVSYQISRSKKGVGL